MRLRVAKDLTLPLELVTESVGILAVKRAGKSYTARRLVEQLHHAGQQVVIVDPKGDWWGIRSSADGKRAGLPVVIVGGEHQDVPLDPAAGELVARMAAVERASMLLDLAALRKHQVATFMTGFLEEFYRLKGQEANRTPVMLVIDEADAIAPQRPQHGEERMLGAAEDIVRRGGQRGIGITLVTQRAAVLNKNVLTQVGVLVLLRTTGKQDIEAVNDWIKHHGQEERRADVMASIAALPRGEAWVWAPGWPDVDGIFRRVAVLPIDTFDSGRTPKPGEKLQRPKTLADVNLEAFRRDMAATIEKAKADDPKALRAEIARLKAEAKKPAAAPTGKTKTVEIPAVKPATVKALERAVDRSDAAIARAGGVLARLHEIDDLLKARGQVVKDAAAAVQGAAAAVVAELRALRTGKPGDRQYYDQTVVEPAARLIREIQRAERRATAAPAEGLTGPQQAILDTVAMLGVRGIEATRESVARWLGIHPNGGSYGTNLGALRASGYLEAFTLTPTGQAAARAQDTGLDAALLALDGEPKRNIIRALLEAGHALSREELAEKLGLHPNGGSYGTNLGWLRTMGLITERGPIATTEGLKR